MLPSIGFFIVTPKSSLLVNYNDYTIEEFEKKITDMALQINWKYCFEQTLQHETLLYFQCEEITGELEKEYGDVHSQILELEFVLL